MDKVLITGGAGFIGINLARELRNSSYDIWLFDDLSRGSMEHVLHTEQLIQADIRDESKLLESMQGMDIVIHLAAYGSVVESVADPKPNFDINAYGTQAVLDCARKASVPKVIFASTGGALIGEATPPVDENSLPRPISPYGASKLCGEAYCHAYAKSYGLETVCLRFANVYGPYSAHKKGAVTKFMKCLLADEPMPIFGDGSATRDYLHVSDLCQGIVQAIRTDCQPGEIFHLASGKETSVLELAQLIAAISGKPNHPIHFYPSRAGEVERNFAQYTKAQDKLGFKPHVDLMKGLEHTWKWFQQHHKHVLVTAETDS
jgi:UDP-glucose 4-epimerase